MKLLVRNLNRKTTEAKLKKLFTVLGIVESCTLVMDSKTGKSKGFGFVEMAAPVDGQKAITTLHGSVVEGNKIHVKEAEQK